MDNQQPSLVEEKRCRICGHSKPISEFHVYATKGRKARITDECLLCHKKRLHDWYVKRHDNWTPEQVQEHNAKAREYRRKDPERTRVKAKHFHAKYRDQDRTLVYAKYGGQCACCGEKEIRFLTVDHVNNDGHIERKKGIYTNGSQFYRWIIQNNFPSDYQLLCFNCNLGKARNGGICPHQEGSTTIPKGSTAKRLEVPSTLRGNDIV